MNRFVKSISARLSLRTPQRESLEILAETLEVLKIEKHSVESLKCELEKVQSLYTSVTDFEREFPSLCFALATGVGKTRLMGAFITYLFLEKGLKNFFVLAPNLTIYNKLIQDFTPNTPKYVFKGISQFTTNPPVIITGENYEEAKSIRNSLLDTSEEIHINIFNISKINSEVRGGKAPRIKRLSEYIGQSYFEYLSSLPDLVLLMDESHRYRASAGVKVLNELNPVLGLELTATPQVETGTRAIPFKNVIYSYPLHKAMEDGFVKEPAVATRENFNPSQYSEDQLERIKLEDGITIHEETKVELEVYARQNKQPIVKPFVLIVAQDTDHATQLMKIIQSDEFFDGRYKNKVITVHSNQRGEEKDETIQQLMAVEDPSSETEIVIHVNMLKEGWDVTNLYTIIPLRAANSKTLVEQSIGRGLRLPYGKRTGVPSVDRLTIIAHDKFQEIIDEANNPNSIIRQGVVIGKDVAKEQKKAITVAPILEERVTQKIEDQIQELFNDKMNETPNQTPTSTIRQVVELVQKRVESLEYLPTSKELSKEEVKQRIIREVKEAYLSEELDLFPEEKDNLVKHTVEVYVEQLIKHTIDIPRIIVQPVGELAWGYHDFDLDTSGIQLQPVEDDILIQHLRTHERDTIKRKDLSYQEEKLEDYLVSALMDFPDVSYDDHADLLYKLASQLVQHLRSYLADDRAVENVLMYNRLRLADLVHLQMKDHFYQLATDYEVKVSKGFERPKEVHYTTILEEGVRHFRQQVEDKSKIKSLVFGGFLKCLYPTQKFDSDSERRFAVICENDANVLKWFKPSLGQLKIYYGHSSTYNPDFVVETTSHKYICEIKSEAEMDDKVVQDKAKAVVNWCKHASEHERQHGGKEWSYLLIPHNEVQENMTIEGFNARYIRK
ncbi:DEAD/DEAH box helicase family protein [Brevibacillus borstelensis]|jgi:type III restriction enzyme|uniref:DEAD/DEAH box helicase family protein n=1 Tax=Brevibacillus borstelensis TaxID=45462 RepID=UPI001FAA3F41|nr:DEAD/DEAH box helicase family protein [Brevibacillus borstelensis]